MNYNETSSEDEGRLGRVIALWPTFVLALVPLAYNALGESCTVAGTQAIAVTLSALMVQSHFYRPGDSWSRVFFRLLLLWLAVVGISTVASLDPPTAMQVFTKLLGLVLVVVSCRYALISPEAAGWLGFAAAVALFGHGILGIAQYARGMTMPASWIDPSQSDIISARAFGLLDDPNLYAAFLVALVPWALAGFLAPVRYGSAPLYWAGLGAGIGGIFVSFSRSGYFALLVALIVFYVLPRGPVREAAPEALVDRRYTRQSLVVLAVLLIAVFVFGAFGKRFVSSFNPTDMTLSQRFLINKGLMAHCREVPVLGFGLNSFSMKYPSFRLVGGDYPLYAHNEILQSWFETGPLGALLLVVLVVVLLGRGLWRVRRAATPAPWPQAAGLASLAALAVQNLSGFSARIYPISVLLAIAVAAVLSGWMRQNAAPRLWVRRGRAITLGLVMVGVFFLLTLRNLHLQLALASARSHLAENRVLTADSLMHSVLLFNADNAEVHFVLAQVHEANGDLPMASREATLATGLNPHEALFWRYRGQLAAKIGSLDDQLPYLEKTVALDPASEQFRLEIANLLVRLGRPRDALRHLQAAMATSPGFRKVYTGYQEVESFRKTLQMQVDSGLPPTLSGVASGVVGLASDPVGVKQSPPPPEVASPADLPGMWTASGPTVWPPRSPAFGPGSGGTPIDSDGGSGSGSVTTAIAPPVASAADDPGPVLRPAPPPRSRGGIDFGP